MKIHRIDIDHVGVIAGLKRLGLVESQIARTGVAILNQPRKG
jgi:hypothetical protein